MIVERDANGIATLTLNRPEQRNALTALLMEELLAVLRDLDEDDGIRAVILRGAGSAFCAGMDLNEMLATREQSGWFDYGRLPEVLERLAHHRNPTIAVVHGAAIAGGCELALHCDVRIGSPEARFAMPLARLGLVAPAYAIKRLVDTAGVPAAKHMLLTAAVLDGVGARERGLLTHLERQDSLEACVAGVTQRIVECAPRALQAMKAALATIALPPADEAVNTLDAERLRISRTPDMLEGVRAFLERRPAHFTRA